MSTTGTASEVLTNLSCTETVSLILTVCTQSLSATVQAAKQADNSLDG